MMSMLSATNFIQVNQWSLDVSTLAFLYDFLNLRKFLSF